jgi:hypothetical protein
MSEWTYCYRKVDTQLFETHWDGVLFNRMTIEDQTAQLDFQRFRRAQIGETIQTSGKRIGRTLQVEVQIRQVPRPSEWDKRLKWRLP